ncbi:MAG: aminotransferase class IV [Myxococcales bacterium]|nr:aminotransferase class IV [Myxococcales bacterium]
MSVSERSIWLDGRLVPWEQVTVHVLGQSLQRGSLIFDVIPVYATPDGVRVFGLREHVERFLASAELNEMELAPGLDELLGAIADTLHANPGCEVVKLSAYWPGVSLELLPADASPSVAIAAFSQSGLGGNRGAGPRAPARLMLAEPIKMPPEHLSPQLKIAASYTASATAKLRAVRSGFDDILLLDGHGEVTESSTQSFFLVERGVIYTAPLRSVLAGITRSCLLELIAAEGIACKEDRIPLERLESADEAFLCGSTIGVWGVAGIDEREFRAPGPITDTLSQRFARVVAGQDPEFSPRWMQALS